MIQTIITVLATLATIMIFRELIRSRLIRRNERLLLAAGFTLDEHGRLQPPKDMPPMEVLRIIIDVRSGRRP